MRGYKRQDLFGCKIKILDVPENLSQERKDDLIGKELLCRTYSMDDTDVIATNVDTDTDGLKYYYILDPIDKYDVEILDNSQKEKLMTSANIAFEMVAKLFTE